MKFIKLLLVFCLFTPLIAFAEVSTIYEDGKAVGVEAKDDEFQTRWTVRHISAERGADLHGPVNHDGKWVYAIGGDVLTLSDDGQIVERIQYPALIGGLRVEGGNLLVTLNTDRHIGALVAEVPHAQKAPGRGVWSSFVGVALRPLSDVPVDIRKDDTTREDWERELPNLVDIEKTDLTNPIVSAYLGLAHQALGQDVLAGPAFERAIARSATWSDDLMVCGTLERAGKVDAAKTTCARAVDRMKEADLRPEAVWSLILMVATTQDLRTAMADAVEAKDYEKIDRIAGYYRAAFPNGEASAYMWNSLGAWLAQEGQQELGARWKKQGEAVESTPLHRLFYGQTRFIDLAILIMGSAGFGVFIAGVAMGIGSQRRRPGGEGWRRFLCPPTLVEAISVVAFLSFTIWAGVEASRGVSQIGQVASMPMAVLSDNLGSPDVIVWLERFDESPAKAELLTYAKHELAAMKSGQEITLAKPPADRIADLVRERSKDDAGFNPLALFQLAGSLDGGTGHATGPGAFFLYLSILPGLLFFMIVGRLGSSLFARKKLIVTATFVPGSLSGALAPWVATAVIAGFHYATTPIGSILHNISTPAFSRYFGLQGIGTVHVEKPDLTMMVVVLVVGLGVHIASLIYFARSKES